MRADFYDIESLQNVFTLANYKPYDDHIDFYVLCDTPGIISPNFYQNVLSAVHKANKNFTGTISIYDLHQEQTVRYMASVFGVSTARFMNNPDAKDSYGNQFRITCDTDPGYSDEVHPYYMGYNSYNYDTSMLALFFDHTLQVMAIPTGIPGVSQDVVRFVPVTAAQMREDNNILFSEQFKSNMPDYLTRRLVSTNAGGKHEYSQPDYSANAWMIRKNMLMSGRHVDVARLNEKSLKVALKRLLGMLGGQILESTKLRPGQDEIFNEEELCDLLAYNASDVINLKLKLFDHPVYQGQFSLKHKLLQDYPELVYDRDGNRYAPKISQQTVRRDRLFVDSSSAQLATKALCPYEHLTDIPTVSFMYPSERKAKELGMTRVNVLDELQKFFYDKFPQPHVRAEFDKIYRYYKNIEGRNFNASRNYMEDYGEDPHGDHYAAEDLKSVPKTDTCMCYYNADGTPSRGFVTFSVGGIHGAEYNQDLYLYDMYKYQVECYLLQQAMAQYPDPMDLKKAKRIVISTPDDKGVYSDVEYTAGKFIKAEPGKKGFSVYKPFPKAPELFKNKDGATALNPQYTFTSSDPTNHEDFTSYYPNLLRMMSAFYNDGLGYDRYAEIFYQKQDLGVLMKDKNADYAKLRAKTAPDVLARYDKLRASSGQHIDPDVISDEERAVYAVQREGTKLILNSASGAADATFESNIRMNNQIISMRVIGQIFSFRIGAAQTFYGAKVTSTNTDGLFTVMEAGQNNKILEQESKDIGVEIEPEPTYLISKDTNNRIELDPVTGDIQAASGGTLACRAWAGKKGPNPSKNLAHSAITDWALSEYLVFAALDRTGRASLDAPFNPEVGYNILKSAASKMDKVRLLNMFQNVIASSTGSVRYNFALDPADLTTPIVLQHYNRVFIMKDRTPGTVFLRAAVARKLTPVQIRNRQANNERIQQNDGMAADVLTANGVDVAGIPTTHEVVQSKITNVESNWYMLIENRDLNFIPDNEVDFILENMDYGKYLLLLGEGFEKNWRNQLPNGAPKTDMDPFGEDLESAMAQWHAAHTPKAAAAPEPVQGTGSEPAEDPKVVEQVAPVVDAHADATDDSDGAITDTGPACPDGQASDTLPGEAMSGDQPAGPTGPTESPQDAAPVPAGVGDASQELGSGTASADDCPFDPDPPAAQAPVPAPAAPGLDFSDEIPDMTAFLTAVSQLKAVSGHLAAVMKSVDPELAELLNSVVGRLPAGG